jgi:hypothetical protein
MSWITVSSYWSEKGDDLKDQFLQPKFGTKMFDIMLCEIVSKAADKLQEDGEEKRMVIFPVCRGSSCGIQSIVEHTYARLAFFQ